MRCQSPYRKASMISTLVLQWTGLLTCISGPIFPTFTPKSIGEIRLRSHTVGLLLPRSDFRSIGLRFRGFTRRISAPGAFIVLDNFDSFRAGGWPASPPRLL